DHRGHHHLPRPRGVGAARLAGAGRSAELAHPARGTGGAHRGRPDPATARRTGAAHPTAPAQPHPGLHRTAHQPPDEVARHTKRRSEAHRDSSYRFDSWVLRSTLDTCVSTVFTEMNSSEAIS